MTSITTLDTSGFTYPGTVVVDTRTITGGTLYVSTFFDGSNSLVGGASSFVPFAATPPTRFLALTSARSDAGVGLTATAAAGAMGISRTAGTSLALVSETTSASAVTDKAMWEFDLPDTYVAGAAIPVVVNAAITGTGTLTAASCTVALACYSEVNGVETALTVTGGAIQIVAAGSDLTWSVAGVGRTPGERLVLETTMVVTSSSGANTGQLRRISYSA